MELAQVKSAKFQDIEVNFTEAGYLNATIIAKKFGKMVKDYLKTEQTKEYILALSEAILEESEENSERTNILSIKNQLVIIKKGGNASEQGTWLHPKLAIDFARWLNPKFAVWCDIQISQILSNKQPSQQPLQITSIEDLLNASLEQGKTATEICNQVTKAESISFGIGSLHGKGLNKRKKEKKILKELQAITLKWMQFKLPFIESKAV